MMSSGMKRTSAGEGREDERQYVWPPGAPERDIIGEVKRQRHKKKDDMFGEPIQRKREQLNKAPALERKVSGKGGCGNEKSRRDGA